MIIVTISGEDMLFIEHIQPHTNTEVSKLIISVNVLLQIWCWTKAYAELPTLSDHPWACVVISK